MPIEPIAITRNFERYRPVAIRRDEDVLASEAILALQEQEDEDRRLDETEEIERSDLARQIYYSREREFQLRRFEAEIELSLAVEPEIIPVANPYQIEAKSRTRKVMVFGSLELDVIV